MTGASDSVTLDLRRLTDVELLMLQSAYDNLAHFEESATLRAWFASMAEQIDRARCSRIVEWAHVVAALSEGQTGP